MVRRSSFRDLQRGRIYGQTTHGMLDVEFRTHVNAIKAFPRMF